MITDAPARQRAGAPHGSPGPLERIRLPDARADRLYFAQVHEDPRLELEALAPAINDTVVVVSSGGCTALSLLAAGQGRVTAVDLNETQNHVVELKAAAVTLLGPTDAIAFLGAAPAGPDARTRMYEQLRDQLTPGARRYWNERPGAIRSGILGAGVSERFMATLAAVVRLAVHPRARIERLLACRTIGEQRDLYEREWNSWRWRLFFTLLLGRRSFDHAYDPAFFRHVENRRFSEHFRKRFEHTVTHLPVADNYFLHHALAGRYPQGVAGGVPPYLTPDAAGTIRDGRGRLTLVDGPMTTWLRRCPAGSIAGFSLSNICEWLDADGIDALFAESVRTARPGATLCFRNFVGWTEVPPRWRDIVIEDRARGEALLARDRSLVNRCFAVCRIAKEAA